MGVYFVYSLSKHFLASSVCAYVTKVTKTAWGPEVRALVGRWKTLESTGMYLTYPQSPHPFESSPQ